MYRFRRLLPLLGLIGWAGCSSSSSPDSKVQVADGRPNGDLLSDDQITGGSTAAGDQSSCLGETHQAERLGLDIFLMLDISASMGDSLPGVSAQARVATKWDAVKQSLETFIQAPQSADIGVGLQYFPQQKPGVPASCKSDTECGAGAPCTTSVCVVRATRPAPLGGRMTVFEPAAVSCQGDSCFCSSDADCGAGQTCRSMPGSCIVPGLGGFLDNPPPLCNTTADCAGINIPGVACETLQACEFVSGTSPVPCTQSLGCPANFGNCTNIGISVFGLPAVCAKETSCDTSAYSTPAVPISNDAARARGIVASLEAVILNGRTPTGPAVSGALDQARSWATAHPDRQVVTVLATDGFPTDCDPQQIPDVGKIVAVANSGAEPLRTFVIGVFGAADLGTTGKQNLDSWADAGGTNSAFVINTSSSNVADDFLNALNKIRDTAVSCQFQLASAGALDFDKVNLTVNDPKNGALDLSNVGDISACGQDQGWYYIRGADGTPTQINVCPSTCDRFSTAGVSAELQVGCATRIR